MSAPHLPGILSGLAPAIDQYGYLAVAGLVLLEDFGVPVPGETTLVVAAVFAGAGRLNVVVVAAIAFAAAVIGDNIGYTIGRFGGRALVLRWGRYVFITEPRLDRVQRFMTRYGNEVVVVARFIEGLRQANGIIAGISDMPLRQFVPFNALGAALWVAVWVTIGYTAGAHIGTVYSLAIRYEIYLAIAVAVVLLALLGRWLWRRRRDGAPRRKGPG